MSNYDWVISPSTNSDYPVEDNSDFLFYVRKSLRQDI